eukprot:Clim_evm7s172 gene=Clim_evmTU7s172
MNSATLISNLAEALDELKGGVKSTSAVPVQFASLASSEGTVSGSTTDSRALGAAAAIFKNDQSIQTELHPIVKFINPKYAWNEWELRRQALKLANLRKCATHSTQTMQSHFRKNTETQVWEGKGYGTQTVTDSGSSPVHKVTIYSGLHGKKDVKFALVNLKLDV